jgi:hypothetical protein
MGKTYELAATAVVGNRIFSANRYENLEFIDTFPNEELPLLLKTYLFPLVWLVKTNSIAPKCSWSL